MITYSLNEFTNYHTMTYPPHVMLYAPDYMRHNPTHPLDQVCKLNWSPNWAQLQTVCVCMFQLYVLRDHSVRRHSTLTICCSWGGPGPKYS